MKNLFFFAFVFLLIQLFSPNANAQSRFKTYANGRFEFSISYPSDLLKPQPEPANGDGRAFKNADAEMRVFGSLFLLNETLEKEYAAMLKDKDKTITYKTAGAKYFVVSGTRSDGKIFYQKTVENADGAFITFQIEYKRSKRVVYDKLTEKIVKSLKT